MPLCILIIHSWGMVVMKLKNIFNTKNKYLFGLMCLNFAIAGVFFLDRKFVSGIHLIKNTLGL